MVVVRRAGLVSIDSTGYDCQKQSVQSKDLPAHTNLSH